MKNNYSKILFPFLFFSIILFAGSACMSKPPKRVVNRVLTNEEMTVPEGRFQSGGGFNNSGQVRMSPILEEPVLDWSMNVEYPGLLFWVLVDSDGGVWMPSDATEILPHVITSRHQIRRYHPDGSFDWDRIYLPKGYTDEPSNYNDRDPNRIYTERVSYVEPIIALNNAVVLYASRSIHRFKSSQSSSPTGMLNDLIMDNARDSTNSGGYTFLECVDFDGNTIWRTEHLDGAVLGSGQATRISENRIAMTVNREYLNIYDLADGELIETITPDGWFFGNSAVPIEGPEGTWFGVLSQSKEYGAPDIIAHFNNDGTINWSTSAPPIGKTPWLVLSNDGTLMAKDRYNLTGINSLTGDSLWTVPLSSPSFGCGVTPDGNYIAYELVANSEEHCLLSIAPDGNRNWDIDLPDPTTGHDNVIIFNDGSLLVGYNTGISLLAPDSQIIWTIDLDDLNVGNLEDSSRGVALWNLFPFPDGRIVAHAEVIVSGEPESYIFSLKPPM